MKTTDGANALRRFAVAAGILLIAGGLIGLGLTYREMKIQRHLHDKLAGVPIELSKAGPEGVERFTSFGSGLYTLYLATLVAPHPARTGTPYAGMVEYTIADSGGRIRYMGRLFPGNIAGPVPDSATVVPLDTVYIPDAGAELRLAARVLAPDSAFARTRSELFIMPPSDPAFGDNLRRQSMFMAGMGLTVVLGFCIIVFGGRSRQPA